MRLTFKTLLLATILSTAALTGAVFAQATPDISSTAFKTALDRDMPQVLKEAGVPSISIARIENGKLAFTAAYGEQSAGVPATATTLYNVASLTKPVTAETILRMVSEGTLQLDESMARYYTDADIAADPRTALLTPRLALSHQTGLPNWREGALAFAHNPQTGFYYSGEGYQYVARFAAKKWKMPFESLANKYVLAKFGMSDTDFKSGRQGPHCPADRCVRQGAGAGLRHRSQCRRPALYHAFRLRQDDAGHNQQGRPQRPRGFRARPHPGQYHGCRLRWHRSRALPQQVRHGAGLADFPVW